MDCIDNKTGMHKSSPTLQESKANGVFSFTMNPNKKVIKLDDGVSFKIEHAWVESNWEYECVNNKAVIKKDSLLQFVIEADFDGAVSGSHYWLMDINHSYGNLLGAILDFHYSGQDTIMFAVVKEKVAIDTIVFLK